MNLSRVVEKLVDRAFGYRLSFWNDRKQSSYDPSRKSSFPGKLIEYLSE